MTSQIPPYQIQELISSVFSDLPDSVLQGIQVKCGQALGSELYIGCSNGELMRFALHADSSKMESYTILSRQSVLNNKPVDDIVLLPSISRALVLSDHQIHFYTLPNLDVVSHQLIKPIRHVVTFAVDQHHLARPTSTASAQPHRLAEPVDFCVIRRTSLGTSLAMYAIRDRLFFQKDIPLPDGGSLACRVGSSLCIANKEYYNILNLENAEIFPILPLNQDYDAPDLVIQPFIVPTGEDDFLVVSWTGQGSMGIFLTASGDPVRGTLSWSQHPTSICLDLPHVTAILPDGSIEVHNIETQSLVQVVPAQSEATDRRLISTLSPGYVVPSIQRSTKTRKVPVSLNRGPAA